MANEVIKKVRILNDELPNVQFTTIKNPSAGNRLEIDTLYNDFRYRIASQDKNRVSSWSPIERIILPNITTPFPYTTADRITISSSGNPVVVTAIWNGPLSSAQLSDYEKIYNKIKVYDVWIRWTNTNNATETSNGWTSWEFATTVSSNSFSILKPLTSYKTVEIAIQVTTETKLRDYNNNRLTLFKNFGAV